MRRPRAQEARHQRTQALPQTQHQGWSGREHCRQSERPRHVRRARGIALLAHARRDVAVPMPDHARRQPRTRRRRLPGRVSASVSASYLRTRCAPAHQYVYVQCAGHREAAGRPARCAHVFIGTRAPTVHRHPGAGKLRARSARAFPPAERRRGWRARRAANQWTQHRRRQERTAAEREWR